MTWQPIETAPKDGKAVLVYGWTMGQRAKQVSIMWWLQDDYDRMEVVHREFDGAGHVTLEKSELVKHSRGSWTTRGEFPDVTVPTHWMPLPEPPAER